MASSSGLHPAVAADRRLYEACFATRGPATVGELLYAMVAIVGDAVHGGDPAGVAYFTNWHPGYHGASPASIVESQPDDLDVRLAVVRGHGFADWHAAQESAERPFDPLFEAIQVKTISCRDYKPHYFFLATGIYQLFHYRWQGNFAAAAAQYN